MPRREQPPDLSSRYGVRRFTTELRVGPNSPAAGRSLAELRWGERFDVVIVGVERAGRVISLPAGERVIEAGDRLFAQGSAANLLRLAQSQKLDTPEGGSPREASDKVAGGRMVEVIMGPGSALLGRTLRDLHFAQRYDVTVLGVQSHGTAVTDRIAQLEFSVGDILLVRGEADA
ncbi:MAG: TrkA C-terminal domain-containing protein, partial [Gemmatimonadota bacterium]|nr:TrkA C-terminal domain-containing protein [Gemmatimonadota bacterium]